MRAPTLAGLLLMLSSGCWNYRSQLERADEHYRSGRYPEAVTNLNDLEPSLGQLEPDEQARFGYVLGMSHARLGQRADARHWLATTREMLERGASLPEDRRTELQRVFTQVDWVGAHEGAAPNEAAPSVPSGTEPLDTAPVRPPSSRR